MVLGRVGSLRDVLVGVELDTQCALSVMFPILHLLLKFLLGSLCPISDCSGFLQFLMECFGVLGGLPLQFLHGFHWDFVRLLLSFYQLQLIISLNIVKIR